MIYVIAGKRINILNRYNYTTKLCINYLAENQNSDIDFTVEVSDSELTDENDKLKHFSLGYMESILIYRKICYKMAEYGYFLFHGSALIYKDYVYIFTGKSGSGKSTHTNLWLKYVNNAKVLNGDKPIISIEDDKLFAYGTPWNGKEKIGFNGKAEIKAICFIVKDKENKIKLLDKKESINKLINQFYIPKHITAVENVFNVLERLQECPIYELYCDISELAVKTAFEFMIGEKYERGELYEN